MSKFLSLSNKCSNGFKFIICDGTFRLECHTSAASHQQETLPALSTGCERVSIEVRHARRGSFRGGRISGVMQRWVYTASSDLEDGGRARVTYRDVIAVVSSATAAK